VTRASVTRVVDWCDTDAAGHYHHSSVIRWVEAAEDELHTSLGLPGLFGVVPRVRYEVDYLDRLWFRDEVVTSLWVEHVGTSSLIYGFEVVGPRGPAARGRMVCVNVGSRSGPGPEEGQGPPPAAPWPDEVRAALTS
jgi:acyl-CoA thioester hydrolase